MPDERVRNDLLTCLRTSLRRVTVTFMNFKTLRCITLSWTIATVMMASNHQDNFMSLYLNFVALMSVSNASRVSSKPAHRRLLMEFLASFQTCSMGFLSGLYGGR